MVLPTIVLAFFLEAHIMLCLGFLMKIVVMNSDVSVVDEQCLHRAKDFPASFQPLAALPTRSGG